ncbi:MAG: SRPBCC family protein [Nevskia sp.]|nr:SRPBCC family protein [Nevskia sp.]
MSQQKIEVVQDFSKPVGEVFAYLADHNNLRKVFGLPVRRVRDGADDVNGVGSVRRLGVGPLALEETVTALEPNRSIDYRISKGGGPVRNHRGKLEFSGSQRGSRVAWTIQFDTALPLVGPIIKLVLSQGIRQGLKRIA